MLMYARRDKTEYRSCPFTTQSQCLNYPLISLPGGRGAGSVITGRLGWGAGSVITGRLGWGAGSVITGRLG